MAIVHFLVDAPECDGPLNDGDILIEALRAAAASIGAVEYGQAQVRYVPHGITAIIFLAESHMLITTWPEHDLALVDILLCNESMDVQTAWTKLEEILKPRGRVEMKVVGRDVFGCLAGQK